ncbi:hypothetical protein ACIQZO_05825 [Streptomyces sp. NPDC097617]|uniref:hypothetical protein n=1 Tax=Streptomyces sp. NPDC097617 TaxID=3366091 RepID=UPI0038253959
MTRIAVSRTIAALAVAVAAAAACAVAVPDAPAFAAVRAFDDPPPAEEPCPGGEPKPCAASPEDRKEVEDQKEQVEKEEAKAKEDIAAAKDQATKCAPTSKQCMSDLAGDGKEQKEGMAKAQEQLDAVHPAPADNAATVMDGACEAFAAELPAALTSAADPAELTRVCELMNP